MRIILPEWLEEKISDTGGGAYAGLQPELRAQLKRQIAFLYDAYGGAPASAGAFWMTAGTGTMLCRHVRHADLTVILLNDSYTHASGFLAVAIPAVLSKSVEIIVLRLSEQTHVPVSGVMSAAFELSGIEQVYDFSGKDIVRLLAELELQGVAAIKSVDFSTSHAAEFCKAGISSVCLKDRVKVACLEDAFAFDFALFGTVCPDAVLERSAPDVSMRGYDAVISAELPQLQLKNAFPLLCLHPGQECLWLWPELTVDFFLVHGAHIIKRDCLGELNG